MYDSVAILKAHETTGRDEYGNPLEVVTETEVFVQPRGVYQSEYYNAAQNGLKPSLTLRITNREDYDGQKELTFESKDYTVIRVDWTAQRDGIDLICEERVKNG